MISEIIDAIVEVLSDEIETADVVASYDQTLNVEASKGNIITVSGELQPFVFEADGTPIAYVANIAVRVCTSTIDDPSGSTRATMANTVFSEFHDGISITESGATKDATTSISMSAVEPVGEDFLSVVVSATLIVR